MAQPHYSIVASRCCDVNKRESEERRKAATNSKERKRVFLSILTSFHCQRHCRPTPMPPHRLRLLMMKMLIQLVGHRRPRESSDCEEVQAAMSRWVRDASSAKWKKTEKMKMRERLTTRKEEKWFQIRHDFGVYHWPSGLGLKWMIQLQFA